MKHYIEIQRLRTQDVILSTNTFTFSKKHGCILQTAGDIIILTEKIDGANSRIYYDKKLDRLKMF